MSDTTPTAAQPSERAILAIIGWEVSDRETYEKLDAVPTWPGDDSGVTIGIGYDLGYETTIREDWSDQLPPDVVERLMMGEGRTRAAAQAALPSLRGIVVPWDAAIAVFRNSTLARYADTTADVFPGLAALPPDCCGALVSLIYNRGPNLAGDRRREMRGIRDALAQGRPDLVPSLLRAMKRLWPTVRGLRDRREGEAVLFEAGLADSLTDMG